MLNFSIYFSYRILIKTVLSDALLTFYSLDQSKVIASDFWVIRYWLLAKNQVKIIWWDPGDAETQSYENITCRKFLILRVWKQLRAIALARGADLHCASDHTFSGDSSLTV